MKREKLFSFRFFSPSLLLLSKALQLDGPSNEAGPQGDQNKDHYDEVKEKKIAEYEETIRLIKEATGVSDIQEVIVKFQSQGDTHDHLVQLQKTNEARIEELKKKKKQVLAEYDELKFSGESKHAHSRRLIDEFQQHLKDANLKTNEAKLKYERAAKVLTNAEAGIKHLFDKLESIHVVSCCMCVNECVGCGIERYSQVYIVNFSYQLDSAKAAATSSASGEAILSILDTCTQKLDQLVKNIHGKDLPEVKGENTERKGYISDARGELILYNAPLDYPTRSNCRAARCRRNRQYSASQLLHAAPIQHQSQAPPRRIRRRNHRR